MPSDPPLPRGNLEFQRKQAKRLLRDFRAGDPDARSRATAVLADRTATRFLLSDALHVIAAEHGFRSWPRFRQQFESGPRTARVVHRIGIAKVSAYEDRACQLLSDFSAGKLDARRRVWANLPDHVQLELVDARVVIAREYGYPTWRELVADVTRARREYQAPPKASAVRATELIAACEVSALVALLHAEPGLRPESLLERIAQPEHAPERLALPPEVDADCVGALIELSEDLGGPLSIAACFNQIGLVARFLDSGASAVADDVYGLTPLQAAIYHGQAEAGDLISALAVVPDALYVAAGAGRLDLLPRWFDSAGELRPEAFRERPNFADVGRLPRVPRTDDPQEVVDEAFTIACYNGRVAAAEWLLAHGADINGRPYLGITGLHFAVQGDKREMVEWLLERGADLMVRDQQYDSTPLGWAAHLDRSAIVDLMTR